MEISTKMLIDVIKLVLSDDYKLSVQNSTAADDVREHLREMARRRNFASIDEFLDWLEGQERPENYII